MKCDKVNFGSKIIFVDPHKFEKIAIHNFIPWDIDSKFIKIADEFYTNSVRTCTAGAMINTKTHTALGFHLFDCLINYKNLDKILNSMLDAVVPDKCLLFGGKIDLPRSIFSLPILKKTINIFEKNIPEMTLFERHMHKCSETGMCYSLKDDTFYIMARFLDRKANEHLVINEKELKECYKKIKISPKDELIFPQNVS